MLVVVSAAMATHHTLPDGIHMGMQTASVCLAVLSIAAVAVAAAVSLLPGRRPSWPMPRVGGDSLLERPTRGVPARAGPLRMEILRL